MTFINVEPYQLEEAEIAGQLTPKLDANGNLQAAQTTNEWGLYFEPWMFAVDRDGIVRGSYEVAISDRELERHPGDHQRPLTAARQPDGPRSAGLFRVRQPQRVVDPAVRLEPDHDRLGRRLVLDEVPGRELAPFSRRSSENCMSASASVRSAKPRTSVKPSESTRTITPTTCVGVRRLVRVARPGPADVDGQAVARPMNSTAARTR